MLSDLKFAYRQLAKSPGFTFTAILTLALGIGLNTSMFSLMNLLILRPLPYPQAEEIVRVHRTTPQSQTANHSASDFRDLVRDTAGFADLAAYRQWGYTLTLEGRPSANLNGLRVSSRFFPLLGQKPAVGRWFTPEEDQPGNHVIILSYDTWQAQFGGDPAVVGTNVNLDGEATTVVGVMPASFSSVLIWGPADAFRPMGLTNAELENLGEMEQHLIARRAPGVTLEQFNTRLAAIATRLASQRTSDRSQDGLRADLLGSAAKNPGTIGASTFIIGLCSFVLLIACANLANLQLARAVARSHEFAIRSALGASRSRLLRPLLGESMLLAAGGGLFGILVAVWGNDWLSSRLSANGIFRLTVVLDWRVLIFAIGVSALTGLFFGLVPAWLLSRVRVNDSLKAGTRGNTGDRTQHRLQHLLIITQFANAMILLAGAAGFAKSVDHMVTINPGWDQRAIVQCVLNLPPARYADPKQTYAFYQQLQERLAALPGAENATVGWTLPVFQFLTARNFVVEGGTPPPAGHEPLAYVNAAMPTYLDTLGIKVQSGRNFNANDTLTSTPVAMINASMARALFPNEDPIGRHLRNPDPKNPVSYEIVGIVPDVGFAVGVVPSQTPYQVWRPLAQETWNYVSVAVRGPRPELLAEPMRQAIAALDPNLAIQQFGIISEVTKMVTASAAMLSTVLAWGAGLGVFLAALGLYGVIARVVAQRTAEIGVRIALGAQGTDVVWLILRSGLKLTLIGSVVGLLGSAALGWGLSRISPSSAGQESMVPTLAAATALLLFIGLLACWLPARRASKVDPMVALRAE